MDLHAILIRAPVNKLAASVVSQRGAAPDSPLSREELAYLVQRLSRRQRLLKAVLGIKTPSQHANTVYKHKKRIPQFRAAREPRALTEYLLIGQQIQNLNCELAELRRTRQMVAAAESNAD